MSGRLRAWGGGKRRRGGNPTTDIIRAYQSGRHQRVEWSYCYIDIIFQGDLHPFDTSVGDRPPSFYRLIPIPQKGRLTGMPRGRVTSIPDNQPNPPVINLPTHPVFPPSHQNERYTPRSMIGAGAISQSLVGRATRGMTTVNVASSSRIPVWCVLGPRGRVVGGGSTSRLEVHN